MKKSIIKNLLAITFALGALVFVAGNVFADEVVVMEIGWQESNDFISSTKCNRNIAPAVWVARICAGNIPNSIPSVRCGSLMLFARPNDFSVDCAK